jgi:ADP-ribose pyrophosphatase YjhB (NUDIX family)
MTTPTVGILVFKEDSVLLVRHEKKSGYSDHVFGLPSGRLEAYETEIDAAIRELEEETGLVTQQKDLVEFPNNFYISKLPNRKDLAEREIVYSWRVFLCQKYSGTLRSSQETTPQWVLIKELSNNYLLPNVENAVEAGQKFIQQ